MSSRRSNREDKSISWKSLIWKFGGPFKFGVESRGADCALMLLVSIRVFTCKRGVLNVVLDVSYEFKFKFLNSKLVLIGARNCNWMAKDIIGTYTHTSNYQII